MKQEEKVALSSELMAFIDEWKKKPGNLIMILHRVQEEFGYVPRNVAFEVARLINVPLAKIYGVITFYNFFKLEKPGEHNIQVCMGTACYLKGAKELISELENLLGIGVDEITANGKFSMEAVRCVGCCGLAPVLMVDGEVFGSLQAKQLSDVLTHIGEKGGVIQ